MKEMTKQLDTDAYMTELRALIRDGYTVRCTVAGGSMLPFLAGGRDAVMLCAPAVPPGRGDIVVYQRADGAFILHRICRVCADGSYDIIGDAQTTAETEIAAAQIFAVATTVYRKGKKYEKGDALWEFFARVWCLPAVIAHRRPLFSLYRLLHRGSRPETAAGEGEAHR